MASMQTRFSYQGFHGCQSVCGLELLSLADGRTLAICTELPENKGTSVTNFAEELATLVCRELNLTPESLVWIEHYPPGPSHGPKPDWDLVTFDRIPSEDGTRFENPCWRPMEARDWQELGMPERK